MYYYDAVIFDLDGTLWQTRDSYLYAYHEVIKNHPEIKDIFSDTEIISTMGNTLDIVANLVFPNESTESKLSLMKECLFLSCDYLLKNEKTTYPFVQEVVEKLSKNIKLFVVSNCPKEYIEVFFQKSGTRQFFTDYGYLTQEADKAINIKRLINKYNLNKILMVGDSNDDFDATFGLNTDFVYAAYGYKDCLKYNYKIDTFNELLKIINYINYRASILEKCQEYEILSHYDAQIVLMKNDNQKETDYIFGFWQYSSNTAYNEELFDKLEAIVKVRNGKNLLGPLDYTTWFTYRLATDNFEWKLYPDINNSQEQVNFLEQRGYLKKFTYVSTLSTIDYRLWNACKNIKLDKQYQVITVQGQEAYNFIKDIYEITIDCFNNADFYTPISYEDFYTLYLQNINLVNPDIVLIYYDNEPIAFSFCYEDINKQHYVSKTTGIKRKYQNKKLILKLIDESFNMMVKKGYKEVLYHFQNEQKHILRGVWKNTALKHKHYALFSKEFCNEQKNM